MKKTTLLCMASLVATLSAPTLGFGAVTVLETFESYATGAQTANASGTITILDGSTDPVSPTSDKSAMFANVSTQQKYAIDGVANPVILVSFDLYRGGTGGTSNGLRFAFNHNTGGLVTSGSNIIRLEMQANGDFDFEVAASESVEQTIPLSTLMTVHMVFNSSTSAVSYGGQSIAAQSLGVWKDSTYVGQGKFGATNASLPLAYMGFGTGSTYDAAGNFVVDNLSWEPVAVPEPSTFALVAGFLSLGLIILRRRCRE